MSLETGSERISHNYIIKHHIALYIQLNLVLVYIGNLFNSLFIY